MEPKDKQQKIQNVLQMIHGIQRDGNDLPKGKRSVRWQLDITVWQLALEGMGSFAVAFISGLGLGVLFNVIAVG